MTIHLYSSFQKWVPLSLLWNYENVKNDSYYLRMKYVQSYIYKMKLYYT